MPPVSNNHKKGDDLKASLRDSAIRLALIEIGQSLRVRDMVRNALAKAKGNEDAQLLAAKVHLVDAVLELTDGHLTQNVEHSAMHFLRAKKGYNDSMDSMDEAVRIPDSNKVEFKKHLRAHRDIVDEKLGGIERAVIEKVASELAVDGNSGNMHHSYASKYFLAYTIIAKKAQGWKWLMFGTATYLVAGITFTVGSHFHNLDEGLGAIGGVLFGGGTHALLRTRKAWSQAKLLTTIFIDKYNTRHLREATAEIQKDQAAELKANRSS